MIAVRVKPNIRFMASIAVAQGFKVRLIDKAMPSPVAAEMSRKGKPVIATIALTASHVGFETQQEGSFREEACGGRVM